MEATAKRQLQFLVYCLSLALLGLFVTWRVVRHRGYDCHASSGYSELQHGSRGEHRLLHSPTPCDWKRPPPLVVVAIVASGAAVDAESAAAERARHRQLHASVRRHRGFHLRWIFVGAFDSGIASLADRQLLDAEASKYADILMLDGRSFLGFSATLAAIEWSLSSCRGASFLLRTSSNCAVNPFRLVEYLGGLRLGDSGRMFLGYLPYQLPAKDASTLLSAAVALDIRSRIRGDNLVEGPGYIMSMENAAQIRLLATNNKSLSWLRGRRFSNAPDWLEVSLLASLAGIRQRHSGRLLRPRLQLSRDLDDANSCTDWRAIVVRWSRRRERLLAPMLWQHVSAPRGFNPPCSLGN